MIGESVIQTAPASEPVSLDELRAFLRIGTGNAEPAPAAPTVALSSPAAAGNVDDGDHQYLVTFVTADGETEAGQQSAVVTVADKDVNGKVTVSAIPLGGSLVTSRKIYRTVAGGSTFKLLTTLADNTTTSYTDNTADSGLGASAPSTNTTADALLTSLRKAARQHLERITGRAFVTQTWDYYRPCFPSCDRFPLPHAPLASITGVFAVDTAGDETEFDAENYIVDTISEPGQVVLAYGKSWPSTVLQPVNGVRVRYVAGRATGDAWPGWEDIRTAIKMLVDHWYMQSTPIITGAIVADTPFHVHSLIANWRVRY